MDASEITIADSGATFTCPAGENILDAALRQGITLPHNCRGGACGTCKADVVAGSVEHGWVMSFAISDEEKANGQCLACVAKPRSARVVLSMHNRVATGGELIAPLETRALVVSATPLTASVREIVLALDPDCGFRFRPGMHVELGDEAGGGGRPYSIATVPEPDGAPPAGMLTVQVTLHPGGTTSPWLHANARPGARLTLRGPYGTFGFVEQPADGLVLLAGGTGLAPLLSVAGERLRAGYAAPVELGLSVRGAADLFGLRDLETLARAHANFRYWITLTRETVAPWRSGRIPALLRERAAELSGRQFLIAGPPDFVAACEDGIRGLGVPADRVASEMYTARPGAAVAVSRPALI